MPLAASPTGLLRPPHCCQAEWTPLRELPDTCLYGSYFLLKGEDCIYLPMSCLFVPFAHFPIALQVSPLGQDDMVVLTAWNRDPGLALAVPNGELHSLLFFTETHIWLRTEAALSHSLFFQCNSEARANCICGCFVAGLRLSSEFPIAGGICLCM